MEVLLRKLETVEQNQREALLLLRANRHGDPGEASVELLQAQTQAELQELEEHLKNRECTNNGEVTLGYIVHMPPSVPHGPAIELFSSLVPCC